MKMETYKGKNKAGKSNRLFRSITNIFLNWSGRRAAILFIFLFIINIIINPQRFVPSAIGSTIGMMAPLILSAIAVSIVIIAGGGGIDISVGPLMTLVNVIIVHVVIGNWGATSPATIIPIAILLGMGSGLINGFLSCVVNIQPIVATLATYLIYSGLAVWIMPAPGGSIPQWMMKLSGNMSFLPILILYIFWFLFRKTLFYEQLRATGGNDRAAYSSGVNVRFIRMGAYVLTGIIAAIGAITLGALISSADPNVGPGYTMTAIAGAALGGVSLAGGIGGILGVTLGAMDIFLVQSMLTFLGVPAFAIQVTYGFILVVALIVDSPEISTIFRRRKAGSELI